MSSSSAERSPSSDRFPGNPDGPLTSEVIPQLLAQKEGKLGDGLTRRQILRRGGAIAAGGIAIASGIGGVVVRRDQQSPPSSSEPTPTLTVREQELHSKVASSWEIFAELNKRESLNELQAISLLPVVRMTQDLERTVKVYDDTRKELDDNDLAASVTPLLIAGIPLEQLKDEARTIEDNIDDKEGGKYTSFSFAGIALQNETTAKEVYARYKDLAKRVGSKNAARLLVTLSYSGHTIDEIEQGWNDVREHTRRKWYQGGSDEILAAGKVLSGISGEATVNIAETILHKDMSGEFSNDDGRLVSQLTVATIANGHNLREVELMYRAFKDRIKDTRIDSIKTIATGLTLSSVLNDPRSPEFKQLAENPNTLNPSLFWFYFIFVNPTSPTSPVFDPSGSGQYRPGKYGY